ncbi:unnamed protein product, partial [Mesorhabditis belari]|uniref:Uncharacterized protein n=1 Tax=Mesorhabditis belari TaxID=2138241 RepID=A0AAF3FEG2_9BILA
MKAAQWKALQSVSYVGVLTFLVEMLLFVVFLFIYHCRQLSKKKKIVQGSEPSKKAQKERKSLLTVIQEPVDVQKKPGIEKEVEALCDTQPLSPGDNSTEPWLNESMYEHDCTTARGVLNQENEDPLFTPLDDMQDTQLPREEPFTPYQCRPIYDLPDMATVHYVSNIGKPNGYPQKMPKNNLVAFPAETGMLVELEKMAQAPNHDGYNQKPYSPYDYMKSESFDTLPQRAPQPALILRAPSKEYNVATKKATK